MAEVNKQFPPYIDASIIPQWAREQVIEVYRACATGKVDQLSFLDSYTEKGKAELDTSDPLYASSYSLSTYTKFNDLRRFMTLDSKYGVPFKIAKGITAPEYGICLETKEWKKHLGKKSRSSHVDWWLYDGATPWLVFEEVKSDDVSGNT